MTVQRIRGRKGQDLRKRRLQREPLCRECGKEGRITVATEVDHIVPLALGGSDTDENVQSLCKDHHAIKTAFEDAAHHAAANHPDWLRPSAVPLTILCGPPASGKTTYIAERAAPDDLVIDVDSIIQKLQPGYEHWKGQLSSSLLNKAIRVRNALLGSLSRRTHGRAWFIVSAPTKEERKWWAETLGGEIVLLHPGVDECKRRAIARGTPEAVAGIDAWERRAKQPWQPRRPKRRQEIGPDGWPV